MCLKVGGSVEGPPVGGGECLRKSGRRNLKSTALLFLKQQLAQAGGVHVFLRCRRPQFLQKQLPRSQVREKSLPWLFRMLSKRPFLATPICPALRPSPDTGLASGGGARGVVIFERLADFANFGHFWILCHFRPFLRASSFLSIFGHLANFANFDHF